MSKNVEHSSEKMQRSSWRDLQISHISAISTHFFDEVQIFFFFTRFVVIKVTLQTSCSF